MLAILFLITGLVFLIAGPEVLVRGASGLAAKAGISPLVVGLTVVAFGTSAPELAVSIGSTLMGQPDLAVGNVVGSNIFNLLAVLGLSATVSPNGLPVSDATLWFDLPVMIAVALACLPVFFTGYTLARWEGGLFLGYYVAYTAYLVMGATQHEGLSTFSFVMGAFVIPISALTLAILGVRALQAKSK